MDKKKIYHVGWFRLLVICTLPLAFITNCIGEFSKQQQKAFVVVCYNTGSLSPNITVKISGKAHLENLQLPNFTQKSESPTTPLGVSFLTFEGNFTYTTTCAYHTVKGKLGSYFVYLDNADISVSSTKVQVTYETNNMCDGYTAIPIPNLGSEYYAVTFCEVFGVCQIFIVAIDDALIKQVTVKLPDTQNMHAVMFNGNTYEKGNVFTVDLNSMETALIECDCDLTGTKITANSNVAVFSGSRNAIVGVNGDQNFLLEQLPPFTKWGLEYACPCKPYCNKHGAFIRVIAKEETVIHISGYPKVKTTLNALWIHRRIEQDDVLYITADKPILVVMFLLSDQTHTSSMFLIPPVKDQDNTMSFQYPTERFNKMEMIAFSPDDKIELLVNNDPITISQNFNFPSSQLFGSLLEFPKESNDRNIVINKSNGGYGMIGVSTSDVVPGHTVRLGFSLGSFHMIDFNDPAPVYPGDRVDNDADGTEDEDDCSGMIFPDDSADCSNNIISEKDEKGYRFFLVFPFLDIPTRFTVDIMSSDTQVQWTNIDKHHEATCPSKCNVQENTPSHGMTMSFLYEGNCLCMGMNISGKFRHGTHLSFPEKEYTVSVSIHGSTTMATYMALPVEVLGLEYYAVTYCDRGGYCSCVVSVIYNETNIFVKLPVRAGAIVGNEQYPAGSVIRETLRIFESLMFSSADDLTGAYVTANAPIGLICGGGGSHDSYLEQIPPVFALGLNYFVSPNALIRVVATDGNTVVTGDGAVKQTKLLPLPGSHTDLDSRLNITSVVATKPVLVVALHLNSNTDGCMAVMISNSHLTDSHYVSYPFGDINGNIYLQLHTDSVAISAEVIDEYGRIQNYDVESGLSKINGNAVKMSHSTRPFYFEIYGNSSQAPNSLFCTSVGRKMSTIEEVCSPTEQTVGDKKDNDCDGLVDEEIFTKDFYAYEKYGVIDAWEYIPDFDLDGMIDEDCFTAIPVPSTTIVTTTEISPTTSESYENITVRVCYCPCALYKPPDPALVNITKQQLEAIIEETKKKLAVNKTSLSSYIRRKTSADDERPSAAGVGSVGIVILVVVVLLVVGMDLIFIKQHLMVVRN